MVWNAKLRWWQCSLRSLLLLMTLACIVSSVFAWRQARQRYLERLVESFNVAMDEWRFADAETIARLAHKEFPTYPLTENMLEKAVFARQIAFNEVPRELDSGCLGYIQAMPDQSLTDSAWEFGHPKKWEDLSHMRRRMHFRDNKTAIGKLSHSP